MEYIVIYILVGIVALGVLIAIGWALGKFILKKIMFSYSNDDRMYMQRFEERMTRIDPLGAYLMSYASEKKLPQGSEWKLHFAEGTVRCVQAEECIPLSDEAMDAFLALNEVFGEAIFDRIVFHEGRVGFYSQICWKGCAYVEDGKKPKFYEKYKEVFRFRNRKMNPNWYMMLA